MKIVSIADAMLGQGGAETVLLNLEQGLSPRHSVLTVLAGPPQTNPEWPKSFSQVLVGPFRDNPRLSTAWRAIPIARWLRHALSNFQPDVVIAHGPVACICTNLAYFRAAVGQQRPPILLYEHGELAVYQRRTQSWAWRQLYHEAVARADAVVCGGSDLAGTLSARWSVPTRAIGLPIVLPDTVIPRARQTTIVYVGRLDNQQKRIDRLLHACAILPKHSWTLQIVGDGPDREWLHTLSQQLGIGEQCRWSGWHPNPWAVIEEASFLAFPSDFEGFGAVIVEAMAHGIPVLATDCDFGPRTVIQEGINGWLVPRDDTAFAQRLVQLVHGGIELPDPDLVQSTVRDQQRDQWAERLQAVCEAAIASRRRTTSRTRHVSS